MDIDPPARQSKRLSLEDQARARAAEERTHVLREHLVRTAYSLQFSAADLARVYERRAAGSDSPRTSDWWLAAKRWQALSDQAADVVARWDSDEPADDPAEDTVAVDAPPEPELDPSRAAVDEIVDRLFAAGRELDSARSHAAAPVARRISAATAQIDRAIAQIRLLVADWPELSE